MIKKPEELKKTFSNGRIPTQGDFGDLIDSFVPYDVINADDLSSLHEMAVWWRSADRSGMAVTPSADMDTTAVSGPDPKFATLSAAPQPLQTAISLGANIENSVVDADGKWHLLTPITDKTGTWTCSVETINPSPGFKVSGTAIAVSGSDSPRLVQIMDPESLFAWRTLQFKWQKSADGAPSQLALRSRYSFGTDTTGAPARIHCRIEFRSN